MPEISISHLDILCHHELTTPPPALEPKVPPFGRSAIRKVIDIIRQNELKRRILRLLASPVVHNPTGESRTSQRLEDQVSHALCHLGLLHLSLKTLPLTMHSTATALRPQSHWDEGSIRAGDAHSVLNPHLIFLWAVCPPTPLVKHPAAHLSG